MCTISVYFAFIFEIGNLFVSLWILYAYNMLHVRRHSILDDIVFIPKYQRKLSLKFFLFILPPLMTHNKTNSSNISSIIISASNNNRQTKQFNTFDHINFQQLLQKCSRNLSASLLLVYPVHSLHRWFEFCHKENENRRRRRQKKLSSNKSYAGLSSCVGVSLSSTDAVPSILCWIH